MAAPVRRDRKSSGLSNITQQANVEGRHLALFPGRADWDAARRAAGMSTTGHEDMHGGELETSLLLYARPDLVRDSYRTGDHEASDRPHLLVTGMTEYTDNGIIRPPVPG
ncbi:creatininase family protein [Nocardia grenadensis]